MIFVLNSQKMAKRCVKLSRCRGADGLWCSPRKLCVDDITVCNKGFAGGPKKRTCKIIPLQEKNALFFLVNERFEMKTIHKTINFLRFSSYCLLLIWFCLRVKKHQLI